MSKYNFITQDKIKFAFVLGSIGNLIGFKNGSYYVSHGKNIDLSYSNMLVFQFISEGGLSSFDPSGYKLSSEVLFLFETVKTLINNMSLNNLILNYTNLINKIKKDKYERNLDIITSSFLAKDLKYNEEANSSFVIIRCIPIGLIYHNINDIVEKCIQIVTVTHQNGTSVIGGISCALITKMINNKVELNKIIPNLIEELKNIDKILMKNKYGKIYCECKEKYLDILMLFLERTNVKSKALIYPHIRSDFYYRNFNNGSILYYGNHADDGLIVSFDCLMDSIIEGQPSYEKLIYMSCLHLGETSLTGFLSSFWYGLYFGYTSNIPTNLFHNIENMEDILNIGEMIKKYFRL